MTIDRRRAEHLLDGPPDPTDAVSRVLTAAAGPPTEAERRDEAAALEAFRAAADGPAPVVRPRRLVAAIVAGIALALVGVGIAAAAGKLPAPLQRPAHKIFHVPAPKQDRTTPVPSPSTPKSGPTSGTTTPPSGTPSRTTPSGSGSSTSGPSSGPTGSSTSGSGSTSSGPASSSTPTGSSTGG